MRPIPGNHAASAYSFNGQKRKCHRLPVHLQLLAHFRGTVSGNENTTLSDSGSFIINATLASLRSPVSRPMACLSTNGRSCSGATLVPGTITGPVFTNGAWTFGDTGLIPLRAPWAVSRGKPATRTTTASATPLVELQTNRVKAPSHRISRPA